MFVTQIITRKPNNAKNKRCKKITDNHFFQYKEEGPQAIISEGLSNVYLEWFKEANTSWYRSKDRIPINNPFVGGGYMSNKKWPLIEEFILKNSNSEDLKF